MTEIAKGSFGLATISGIENVIVVRLNQSQYFSIKPVNGSWVHREDYVTRARSIPGFEGLTVSSFMLPLFMQQTQKRVRGVASNSATSSTLVVDGLLDFVTNMASEFLKTEPRIEEPTKFGALVRDTEGKLWTRIGVRSLHAWHCDDGRFGGWEKIEPKEVLFPGA